MWRTFFEFLWAISYLIPVARWRKLFRMEKCFDYMGKYQTLKKMYPELNWRKMRLRKGGGSLAFIVDDTVFKVRKHSDRESGITERFVREQRITDVVRGILPVAVPKIELVHGGEYLFYKTHFIPGRVLVDMPLARIRANNEKIGRQIADIIHVMFNAKLPELADLRDGRDGVGMTHGDMCSNIIVNPDTMDVVGIIDWEYAGFDVLWREFFGIFRFRRKMRMTDIAPIAMWQYFQSHGRHAPASGGASVS